MSLFTKYLTIIQEAYYGKKPRGKSSEYLTVPIRPEREEPAYIPQAYKFDDDDLSHLSDKELQERELERRKSNEEPKQKYVDPYEEYNRQKRDEINIQTLSGKLLSNPHFNEIQKIKIFNDPELAYTYALHFKNNIVRRDFKVNTITLDELKDIEKTISKNYEYSSKYAENVLEIPVGEFKKRVKERRY
jgi:hypothetical protein